jgi:DNA adenine methylase
MDTDDFEAISILLKNATIQCADFSTTIDAAGEGDLIFADPPYTTSHNYNGFVKYNQHIFRWTDQTRLRNCLVQAKSRGAAVILTNADHPSVRELYDGVASYTSVKRKTVISGLSKGRLPTTEALFLL